MLGFAFGLVIGLVIGVILGSNSPSTSSSILGSAKAAILWVYDSIVGLFKKS